MQKKSLISTLKTTKKANVATTPAKKEGSVTKKTKIALAAADRIRN
jgi:hypothetical protein